MQGWKSVLMRVKGEGLDSMGSLCMVNLKPKLGIKAQKEKKKERKSSQTVSNLKSFKYLVMMELQAGVSGWGEREGGSVAESIFQS